MSGMVGTSAPQSSSCDMSTLLETRQQVMSPHSDWGLAPEPAPDMLNFGFVNA